MNDILFGNNNKAVIKKLANRSFHSNKMRNVIAAIAIALTTFLFTAVLTIGMGASGTLEYSMAKLMGSSADALVQELSEEQFQQLKENAMFEKVGCWIPVEIMTNTNRRVAEVDYADQNQLEIRMLTPRTGSAPQKANEVLVSANILKDLNIEEKIGSEIPVELKVRQSDQVYHFDMVVSGIYDTPNEKSESVIVSKAFLEENAEMMSDIAQGRVGCGIYTADVVMRDKDKDHCPCLKACRYHGNCKECVAIHRAHQEHVPNCMRPLINKKLKLMSELTEHTLANEIEAPHEILRK